LTSAGLTPRGHRGIPKPPHVIFMGKQYNKVIKKQRRLARLKRKKAASKKPVKAKK